MSSWGRALDFGTTIDMPSIGKLSHTPAGYIIKLWYAVTLLVGNVLISATISLGSISRLSGGRKDQNIRFQLQAGPVNEQHKVELVPLFGVQGIVRFSTQVPFAPKLFKVPENS
jgi:hypothetical protein